ncbi:MAG: hypothetical protein Q9M40_06280 [Sulfurimonas sp.]|nr:hypothetical protein [Sulfurimonas sp.]
MKFIKASLLSFLSLFFISCGENTSSSPITYISSISLNENNITIYSTQLAKPLSATVTYQDGSRANATADVAWSSSDSSILFASTGSIIAANNGGDVNLSISYTDSFNDFTNVHIKKLISIEYSDVNISDIGTAQIVYISGTFENNETNVSLAANITYTSDENTTISDVNATQLTLTIDNNTSSILLRATLFIDTNNAQDFNTTFQ